MSTTTTGNAHAIHPDAPAEPAQSQQASRGPVLGTRGRRWLLVALTCAGVSGAAVVMTRPAVPATQAAVSRLLPTTELYPPEALRKDFYELLYNPPAEPALAFHLLVPKSWQERKQEQSLPPRSGEWREPVLLTALAPRDREDAQLEVSYLRLQEPAQPARLRQLLELHAKRLGGSILARQPGTFNNRPVEDALLRWRHPQLGTCLTRVTLSREGNFLFLVSSSARESSYDSLRLLLGVPAVSFTPLSARAGSLQKQS